MALNFCDISGFGVVGACFVAVLKAKLNFDAAGPDGGCLGACGGAASPFGVVDMVGPLELSDLASDRDSSTRVSLGSRDVLVSSSFRLLAVLLVAWSVCVFALESGGVDSCLVCPDVARGPDGVVELH